MPKRNFREKAEDPLIRLLKSKPKVLKMLGRIWEVLYIEGSSPDIGKRREDIIKEILKEEFGLKVIQVPSTKREWDFSVFVKGKEKKYSIKTTEDISTIKVAWNGFPSMERARRFKFKFPILYVTANRRKNEICVYVFEVDDLKELKKEMKDEMWWIPKTATNPRGFGIKAEAVKKLIQKAEKKDNFVKAKYNPININSIKERYWKEWYQLLKRLASE